MPDDENKNYATKLFDYVMNYGDVLNVEAVFSDETENFVSPVNIEKSQPFKIKIRTAKNNVDEIYLCSGSERFLMRKIGDDDFFDYYLAEIEGQENKFEYYFELSKNKKI